MMGKRNLILYFGFVQLFLFSCAVTSFDVGSHISYNSLAPVSYLDVKISYTLWKRKIGQSQKIGIWHYLHQLQKSFMKFDVTNETAQGHHNIGLTSHYEVYKFIGGLLIDTQSCLKIQNINLMKPSLRGKNNQALPSTIRDELIKGSLYENMAIFYNKQQKA